MPPIAQRLALLPGLVLRAGQQHPAVLTQRRGADQDLRLGEDLSVPPGPQQSVELRVPLELTLSCMQPHDGMHCGKCSKCRERRDAFREAGVSDPTPYRQAPLR